jgi:amino acid permease
MANSGKSGYQFGTFKGVFTPSLLTILGVIMYLRLGWVLGHVGLLTTLVIVTLATSITFLTALSLSALATNMKVGGGGAYYIISRSLGVEAGAAIGLPLYLAQALGISFYIAGFSESVVQVFPQSDATTVGLVTLVGLTALVYFSADLALKSQFIIMAAIAASLVSFFMGGPVEAVGTPADAAPLARLSFWPVFAVFFPAVTGIEAGIAMSGDLKNPAKSLLSAAGYAVDRTVRVDFRISQTNVRYFHPEDAELAAGVAEAVAGTARDFTDYRPSPDPGTIEVWLEG